MKTAVVVLALFAGTVLALDKVPSVMVTTSTNAYTHGMLAGTNLQQDLNFIDAELSRQSNGVVAVSNRAEAAYALAEAAIATSGVSVAISQMTFSYQNTGTWTVAICTGGQAWCYASTQTIGKVHIGMAVTGTMFNAGCIVTSVNYEARQVGITPVCAATKTNTSASFWGSGTYTNIVPARFTRCKITVTGGGGSGGMDSDAVDACAGGGAGGTSIGYWTMATGTAYEVTVGNGGASKATEGDGNTGGTSSFGTLQTATGGTGGGYQWGAATTNYVGVGGVGTGGQLLIRGGSGTFANPFSGGTGGSSYWGGGGAGRADYTAAQKSATPSFGAGGGGGSTGAASGAGGHGIVLAEYF